METSREVAKRAVLEEIVSRSGDPQHCKTILMGHVVMDISRAAYVDAPI